MVNLSTLRSPKYDLNIEKAKTDNTCICCGKDVSMDSKMIQLTTNGYITDNICDVPNSQGWFAIGNDCFKKYQKLK